MSSDPAAIRELPPSAGPGSVGSWVVELAVGSLVYALVAFATVLVIDWAEAWVSGRNTGFWLTSEQVLQIGVLIAIGVAWMALIAPVARLLGHRTWVWVHPAAAMVWGPLLGGASFVGVLVVGGLVIDGRVRLDHLGSMFALGSLLAIVPWPIYLLLRMRGRRGWAAFVVAAGWLTVGFLAVGS